MKKRRIFMRILVLVGFITLLGGIQILDTPNFLFAAGPVSPSTPRTEPKPEVPKVPTKELKPKKPIIGIISISGTVTDSQGRGANEVIVSLYEILSGGEHHIAHVKTNSAGFYSIAVGEHYFNKNVKLTARRSIEGRLFEIFLPETDTFQITSTTISNRNFRLPLPDLRVSYMGIRHIGSMTSRTKEIQIHVKNQSPGAAITENFNVGVYFNSPVVGVCRPTASNRLWDNIITGGLGSGGEKWIPEFTVTIPYSVAPGSSYELVVIVDDTNQILERDEDNNCQFTMGGLRVD